MKVTITDASNGWLVKVQEDKETASETSVFEVSSDGYEAKTFQGVLYHLIEVFGLTGSRYDKERLYIEINPGDKYEEPPGDQL